MKLFWGQGIFLSEFDFKNLCRNQFNENNEKYAADPEEGFLKKSIRRTSSIQQRESYLKKIIF